MDGIRHARRANDGGGAFRADYGPVVLPFDGIAMVGDSILRGHRAGVRSATQHEAHQSEQGNHRAYSKDDLPRSDMDVPVSQATEWGPAVMIRIGTATWTTVSAWRCHAFIIHPATPVGCVRLRRDRDDHEQAERDEQAPDQPGSEP